MSPLRHNISDNKLTELMHITRAQTDLKSPVTVVEQSHRAEYLRGKKTQNQINPPPNYESISPGIYRSGRQYHTFHALL